MSFFKFGQHLDTQGGKQWLVWERKWGTIHWPMGMIHLPFWNDSLTVGNDSLTVWEWFTYHWEWFTDRWEWFTDRWEWFLGLYVIVALKHLTWEKIMTKTVWMSIFIVTILSYNTYSTSQKFGQTFRFFEKIFLWFYYFLHCRFIVKTFKPRNNTYGMMY